ncbi:MAG: gliding motility protein GldN [Bacteroidaceae bacterium]|nr:gliding motility protein GldN [Bacteroidaceae bacterium]MBR0433461.1 gliding motility protein GldN [Bacteroidaceae bacterium]
MKRLLIILTAVLVAGITANAQPAKRRTTTSTTANRGAAAQRQAAAEKKPDRASLMFPTSAGMPEDVVWRRDIYRQLDLLKDANAPLYYPVEPHGKEQNLFTFIFRLFVSGRIKGYKPGDDGGESFDEKDRLEIKDLLTDQRIYFEEEGGKITVPESDIPSAFVKRFYLKESSYFDQRSATYKTRVVALCPVLMEENEFESIDNEPGTAQSRPLFWVRYDDISSYLSRMPVMASNFNNVTNMTVDDYFTLNRYEGKIYKTNNLQGRLLSDYAKNDTAMAAEQKRIEQQLVDFEEHIWHTPVPADSLDSVSVADKADKADKKVARASRRSGNSSSDEKKSTGRRGASAASKRTKTPSSSSSSSAPRVSARRQRR